MIATIILAALVALCVGVWLGYRAGAVDDPLRDPDEAAQRIYEADHARWVAGCEAYRWKCRALRLGWRRVPGRWDR